MTSFPSLFTWLKLSACCEGQEDYWLPVSARPSRHADGKGFNVILQALRPRVCNSVTIWRKP